jgi:translation initiation factor IF-2
VLEEIQSDKISLNILLAATGNITENDVTLASASNAIILGFHVAKEPGVSPRAKHEGVEIRLHHVIYELIDEVRDAMTGLLKPKMEERIRGHAEIKEVFDLGKRTSVAGCQMLKGRATRKYKARVKRNDEVLFEGAIASIRHFQDEVKEIKEPQECGIRLDGYNEFEVGDILEFYEIEEVQQSL